jgi:hypothetical protein
VKEEPNQEEPELRGMRGEKTSEGKQGAKTA